MAARIHPVGGRVVLITGAGSGIGAESARRLAARGARVALIDVDADALARVSADCAGSLWHRADVTDDAALRAAVGRVAAEWGGIDVVVASAGIGSIARARRDDPREFERIVGVNLFGAWRTLHAALPHVIARRGYLLTISSLAAFAHPPGMAAYSASKAGLEAMSDSLRAELAPLGVGVGVAYFSWIDTQMLRAGDDRAATVIRATARPPFHRIHPVADAASAVVDAVERRRSRAFHPRWLKGVLPLRGLVQPLLDHDTRRRARRAGRPAEPGSRDRTDRT